MTNVRSSIAALNYEMTRIAQFPRMALARRSFVHTAQSNNCENAKWHDYIIT